MEEMKSWPAWLYFHINHLPGDHRCGSGTGGLAGVQRPRLTKTKHTPATHTRILEDLYTQIYTHQT